MPIPNSVQSKFSPQFAGEIGQYIFRCINGPISSLEKLYKRRQFIFKQGITFFLIKLGTRTAAHSIQRVISFTSSKRPKCCFQSVFSFDSQLLIQLYIFYFKAHYEGFFFSYYYTCPSFQKGTRSSFQSDQFQKASSFLINTVIQHI